MLSPSTAYGLGRLVRCETLIGHVKLLFCAMDYAKSSSTFSKRFESSECANLWCDVMSAEENENLASDVASLGYPGLSYLKPKRTKGPAEVLLSALRAKNVDARLVEALPWVLLECPDLDWKWLVNETKQHELQNKLGFLTNIAQARGEVGKGRDGKPVANTGDNSGAIALGA